MRVGVGEGRARGWGVGRSLRRLGMVVGWGVAVSCGGAPVAVGEPVAVGAPVAVGEPVAVGAPVEGSLADAGAERVAIDAVLDDWHHAAAEADEGRYFGHIAEDGVFMGTDATERWDKPAFVAYARPHFEKGKAWSFTPTRRHVTLDGGGTLAWFDEALETPNLGPARGSGVLRKEHGTWLIVFYNLTITVPNERFKAVKELLESEATR